MTDRPIIFSARMVRALLAGRKTQTRRIIKPRAWNSARDKVNIAIASDAHYGQGADGRWYYAFDHPRGGPLTAYTSRHDVGDRLYVRENWRVSPEACEGWHPDEMRGWIDYQAGGSLEVVAPSFDAVEKATFLKSEEHDWDFIPSRYRPCIHMPRWSSRLTLTVEGVRVQRVQAISEADAIAEGVDPCRTGRRGFSTEPGYENRVGFALLWNGLHVETSTRWEDNPWVVALTFRVERGNIDRIAS